MDSRDRPAWVAVELTSLGESKTEDGTLEGSLRRDLGVEDDFPIFIPSVLYKAGDKVIAVHLMEGYAFLGVGLPEVDYFALENQPYVSQVISHAMGQNRIRALRVVPPSHVEDLQDRLHQMVSEGVEMGMSVLILDGQYQGLKGEVVGLQGDKAWVRCSLRSLNVVATVPKIFLEIRDS